MAGDAIKTEPAPLHFGGHSERPLGQSVRRGWFRKCPACGRGPLFFKYLKVQDHCPACGEAMYHQKADDAPPYFTILVVGHIVIPIAGYVEHAYEPNMALQMVAWPSLAVLLCLWFLPRIKGALIGLQWANCMHGFGDPAEEPPVPAE
jgi:uncharacterized protein (DUF983 family)